ncbi:hypothetical protein [Desulfolucanica intricata]|uniref:hypothetical protein n=1 Tax=Desulfolucanica intricata TaxID=1285191 RepID=UPI000A54C2B9|nr:hypothetical protein [Desulfolucanica intricata]
MKVEINLNLDEFVKLLVNCDEFRQLLTCSSIKEPVTETVENAKDDKRDKPSATKPEARAEVTLEMVRAKLAALMQSGKQAEVKELLKKYGGEKLSDVPKENYPALLAEAEEV